MTFPMVLTTGPSFRFRPQPLAVNDLAWFRGNAIEIDQPLGDNSLWIQLFAGSDPGGYNAALVRNLKTGAAVEFTGDAPVTRMVFWAVGRAASPEPFIQINLIPVQVRQWSSRYRFSAAGS